MSDNLISATVYPTKPWEFADGCFLQEMSPTKVRLCIQLWYDLEALKEKVNDLNAYGIEIEIADHFA